MSGFERDNRCRRQGRQLRGARTLFSLKRRDSNTLREQRTSVKKTSLDDMEQLREDDVWLSACKGARKAG